MNRLHSQRFLYIIILMLGLAIAVGLILFALKQNINVFLTSSELLNLTTAQSGHSIRLGGMVKKGSIRRDQTGLGVQFIVTDFKHDINVQYQGILPDLFREGKGMIAEGHLNAQGIFIAKQVLAKHDENYMPPKNGKIK